MNLPTISMALILLFAIGYLAIAAESPLRINKAAFALLIGAGSWAIIAVTSAGFGGLPRVIEETAGILLFVMAAMTIVELIDAHDGMEILTARFRPRSRRGLLIGLGVMAFVLSAVLDNLTTAIVMIILARKFIPGANDRANAAGIIVIAANAGGAASPIGDITTTMLWISGRVTSLRLIGFVLPAAAVCAALPVFLVARSTTGRLPHATPKRSVHSVIPNWQARLVAICGVLLLLGVPVFKSVTHLPPFIGMSAALGILWLLTEIIHRGKSERERQRFSAHEALRRIDTASVMFFLGILLAVGALAELGILHQLAAGIGALTARYELVAGILGLASAVIDNVPLVAAGISMYGADQYAANHPFWHLLAYASGTGGSLLIIGSSAGVMAMGMERIGFSWYLRKFFPLALAGYAAGGVVFVLQQGLLGLFFA